MLIWYYCIWSLLRLDGWLVDYRFRWLGFRGRLSDIRLLSALRLTGEWDLTHRLLSTCTKCSMDCSLFDYMIMFMIFDLCGFVGLCEPLGRLAGKGTKCYAGRNVGGQLAWMGLGLSLPLGDISSKNAFVAFGELISEDGNGKLSDGSSLIDWANDPRELWDRDWFGSSDYML